MYVDTNSSVRSWQILYVNYVLQYVNGNAVSASFLFALRPPGRGGWGGIPRGLGRHSGAGWRLARGLNNGLGQEVCAMETVGCINDY